MDASVPPDWAACCAAAWRGVADVDQRRDAQQPPAPAQLLRFMMADCWEYRTPTRVSSTFEATITSKCKSYIVFYCRGVCPEVSALR